MELLDAYVRAVYAFDARIRGVRADHWGRPTPCADWSVRDLVNHIVTEQRWVPLLLRGATTEQLEGRFDGDQLGDDPVRAWSRAADAARGAWSRPGVFQIMVNLDGNTVPASFYGWQTTLDIAVHVWDLSRAIEMDDHVDEDLARTLLTTIASEEPSWHGPDAYIPPLELDDGTAAGTILVAMLGRDPAWTAMQAA